MRSWIFHGRMGVGLLALLTMTACVASREPLNLGMAKAAVIAYHDSGDYLRDVARVAERAQAWIEQRTARPAPGEKLAVVFDIDETVLSTFAHMRSQDFGYVVPVWTEYLDRGASAGLAPMVALAQAAQARGVAVVFITGRRERDRAGTEKNLHAVGLGGYERLVLSGDRPEETTTERKTAARRELTAAGWTIIANLGDQASDLAGGYAERTFKVPNPFYRIE